MKRISLLGAIFVLALLLTACGGSGTATATQAPMGTSAPTMAATGPAMTESPAATESAGATEPANSTEAPDATEPTGVPVTGPATVMATNLGTYGPALVDGNGMALYMYTKDTQNSGKSTCNDAECLEEWPPLLTAGQPAAGDGLDASKLGTLTRDDGTTQVTYNGWPLYYFYTDTKPGDVTGQGDDNVWYLVSPSGDVIK